MKETNDVIKSVIPEPFEYEGNNIYLNGKKDGFNECLRVIKENLMKAGMNKLTSE